MATIQDFRRPEIEAEETPACDLQPKADQRKGGFRLSFFFRFLVKATKPKRGRTHDEGTKVLALEASNGQAETRDTYTWGCVLETGICSVSPPDSSATPMDFGQPVG